MKIQPNISILPCPYCGSECRIETENFSNTLNYRVRCIENFHALDWWEENENDAIKVWNERIMKKEKNIVIFTMIKFGVPDSFGNIYTKESFDYKGLEFMKSTGDIIDYIVTDEKIDVTFDVNHLNNNAIDIT